MNGSGLKPKQRLLRITTGHFVAGAIFEKQPNGLWQCIKAAPIIAWMLKHDGHKGISSFLNGPAKKNGWRYEWL